MNENNLLEENRRLAEALDQSWRKVMRYPFGQVCKHLIAANMLSDMEELGFVVTYDLACAVVRCDDEVALATPSLSYHPRRNK